VTYEKHQGVGIIKLRIDAHYFLNINNRSFILFAGIKPYIRISSKKPRPEDGALNVAPGGGGTGYPQRG
jgi:hypothetical protein